MTGPFFCGVHIAVWLTIRKGNAVLGFTADFTGSTNTDETSIDLLVKVIYVRALTLLVGAPKKCFGGVTISV